MKKLCLCLYGETCSGKSTVGKFLASRFSGRYISFGDLKRDEIAKGSLVGLEIKALLDRGRPLPADLGFKVIESKIGEGLNIVSGFPISTDEFDLFSIYLSVVGMLVLRIDEQAVLRRFNQRGECPLCHMPGIYGGECQVHKILMVKRPDANPNELVARKKLYTERIIPFLKSQSVALIPRLSIDVGALSVDEVASLAEGWVKELLRNTGGYHESDYHEPSSSG